MANATKPTYRTHHINIQHFAIQDNGCLMATYFFHIPGTKNPSNTLTKALGWAPPQSSLSTHDGPFRSTSYVPNDLAYPVPFFGLTLSAT